MHLSDLPTLNACLNALATFFILAGLYFIRTHRIFPHRLSMMLAFISSTLFLTSYLIYHFQHPMTVFEGEGFMRIFYYGVLISHIILSIFTLPMVLCTVYFGISNRLALHRRFARWTYPAWLYISVTGIMVYGMLYHL